MTEQGQPNTGKYIYAVVSACLEWVDSLSGIDGGNVYTISEGRVTAVVTDIANDRVRPERRNLAAHQEVLKRLMGNTSVLPMRFGIIADSRKVVQDVLSLNEDAFLDQLQRVAAKVEMGLRVTWDVPNIFQYFADTHPGLRATRDRLFAANRRPSHDDRIELGEMFNRILNEDRDVYAEKVEEVLSPHCSEIKRNTCRNEKGVMNLACLVGRDAQAEFEEAIFEAAKLFDNNFTFDYNGPWAPHNFVEMDLKLWAGATQ